MDGMSFFSGQPWKKLANISQDFLHRDIHTYFALTHFNIKLSRKRHSFPGTILNRITFNTSFLKCSMPASSSFSAPGYESKIKDNQFLFFKSLQIDFVFHFYNQLSRYLIFLFKIWVETWPLLHGILTIDCRSLCNFWSTFLHPFQNENCFFCVCQTNDFE